MTGTAIINFHGIGTPPAGLPDGEDKYWVSPDAYRAFLDRCCVGTERTITFDDGNASDLRHGAPELEKRGLRGAFFICANRIGRPGYLSTADLRELVSRGHTVGSHGRKHLPWPELDDTALHDEAVTAAHEIAAASGAAVTQVAIPFGRYDRRVLGKLNRAGYARVYSSDGMARLSKGGVIPRYSVRSDLPMAQQFAWFEKPPGLARRLRQEAKLRIKARR
jgi:peptidoglycan/xylan/chitin deacetylase (PgdA/CDA1 family)